VFDAAVESFDHLVEDRTVESLARIGRVERQAE
jgi:hypothetical protein